jgi:RNA polymerase sigma-70 factor (ECF subfamily)
MNPATAGTFAESVVDLAASGDQAAFARLIDAHHAQMMRVAHVITGDHEGADDAVQSAWEIAWRRLHSLRDRTQVRAWLMAVAANEARQVRRRQHRRPIVDISALVDLPGERDPADAVAVIDLKRALESMKPEDRTLLALRFVGHLDSDSIAHHLGLSASGVRSRLARLLERLRMELDSQQEAAR